MKNRKLIISNSLYSTCRGVAAAGLAICLMLSAVPRSNAAVIIVDPTKVTQSTELGSFNRVGNYTVDGSGLAGNQHTNAPGGTMWLSNFGASIDPDPWIMYDLGDIYRIDSFHIWNYNEGVPDLTNRGINQVEVQYGNDLTVPNTVPGITNFAEADGTNTYTGEDFSGFTPFRARFIRFEIANGVGIGNFAGGDSYGLSEVQFDGELVIRVLPEPDTLALYGVGIGMICYLRKRKK